jgi:hypothetical protein
LDDLSDVNIDGIPVDRAILAFNAVSARWENLDQARLDFVFLSTDDDEFTIISDAQSPGKRARLNLGTLPNNANNLYNFPNASGTFALQNQFTITQSLTPTPVAAPLNTRVDAFATCATGKAIGVGIASLFPVQVEDMLIIDEDTVRITVRAVDANTTVQAIAFCMTMP